MGSIEWKIYWCQSWTFVDSVVAFFVIFIALSAGIGSAPIAGGMAVRVKREDIVWTLWVAGMFVNEPLHGDDLLFLMLKVEHVGRVRQFLVASGCHRHFRGFQPAARARRSRRRWGLQWQALWTRWRSRTRNSVSWILHFLSRLSAPLPSVGHKVRSMIDARQFFGQAAPKSPTYRLADQAITCRSMMKRNKRNTKRRYGCELSVCRHKLRVHWRSF